jgi:hypothetical protein
MKRLPPNKCVQPTRAVRGALRDRWHFDGIPDLSLLYLGAGG